MAALRAISSSLGLIALVAGAIWWLRGLPEDEPNASSVHVNTANAASAGATHAGLTVGGSSTPTAVSAAAPVGAQSSALQALDGTARNGDKIPRLTKPLDWNQYPGTLNDQVEKALVTKDGEMSADLAAKILECEQDSMVLEVEGSQGGGAAREPALQAVRSARLQELHRHIASCQTIAGDQKQVRIRLLDTAMEQKVLGAAALSFQAGVFRPDVLQRLARDAEQGDISSLSHVATYKAALFGIDPATQQAARYALKIASEDPVVGNRIINYYKRAEILAVVLAEEKSPKFDFSNMSDATRAEGNAIAARLVQRLTTHTTNGLKLGHYMAVDSSSMC